VKLPPGRATESQLSPRGTVLLALSVFLVFAGAWQVDGVLGAMGLSGFCLLVLAWGAGLWNLSRIRVEIECPAKVHAGVFFPLALAIHNDRRVLDAFALTIELEVAGKTRVEGSASWIAARSAADLELRLTVPDRGNMTLHRVRVASQFPLGLFLQTARWQVTKPLLVFPRPLVPRELSAPGVLADASPMAGTSVGEAAGEPRGLRPWRGGDSPRRIAWPATIRSHARGAGLLVREADPPGFQPLRCVVLFHSFATDGSLIRPDRFERALSLACGTLRHLHGAGLPVRLIGDFDGWKDHPAATRTQLAACMEVLARAVRSAGTELHDLQAAAERLGDEESLIVLSDMPAAAWRGVFPKRRLPPMAIDIAAYDGTRKRPR
jgi:uncharacterized protein (DUF58 family)